MRFCAFGRKCAWALAFVILAGVAQSEPPGTFKNLVSFNGKDGSVSTEVVGMVLT